MSGKSSSYFCTHAHIEVEALHVRMENIRYETDTDWLQRFCDEQGVRLHMNSFNRRYSQASMNVKGC